MTDCARIAECSVTRMFLRFPCLLLALASAASLSTAAAPAPQPEWVRVPQSLMLQRFVLAAGAKPEQHRVALVLRPKRPFSRIVTSCGDKSVDRVAVEIAQDLVAADARLKEMAKTKELEFRLELVPPRVAREGRETSTYSGAFYDKTAGGASAFTPHPSSPKGPGSLVAGGRELRLDVRFDATTGLCDRSILVEPTRWKEMDVECLFYAIYYWKLVKPTGKPEYLSQALSQDGPG